MVNPEKHTLQRPLQNPAYVNVIVAVVVRM